MTTAIRLYRTYILSTFVPLNTIRRLSAPLCIENAVKIRVRKSPPISPSSNGFPEKPIRIFDRTERFFAPKSRFWQCVKSTGYAELHPKSCRLIRFKKWIFTEFSLFRS